MLILKDHNQLVLVVALRIGHSETLKMFVDSSAWHQQGIIKMFLNFLGKMHFAKSSTFAKTTNLKSCVDWVSSGGWELEVMKNISGDYGA